MNHHIPKKNMDHGNKGQLQNPLSPSSFHTMPSYTIFFNFELFTPKEKFCMLKIF
jgi:hypothetical protein